MSTATADGAALSKNLAAEKMLRRVLVGASVWGLVIGFAVCFVPSTGEAADLVPPASGWCGPLQLAPATLSPSDNCRPPGPLMVGGDADHSTDAPPPGDACQAAIAAEAQAQALITVTGTPPPDFTPVNTAAACTEPAPQPGPASPPPAPPATTTPEQPTVSPVVTDTPPAGVPLTSGVAATGDTSSAVANPAATAATAGAAAAPESVAASSPAASTTPVPMRMPRTAESLLAIAGLAATMAVGIRTVRSLQSGSEAETVAETGS
jgi:hypothetical protein